MNHSALALRRHGHVGEKHTAMGAFVFPNILQYIETSDWLFVYVRVASS